jgi:fumarylacetoacetate (FAA) hydrolase
MKFFSYLERGKVVLGVAVNESNKYVNVEKISNGKLPNNFDEYLINFEFNNIRLKELINNIDFNLLEEINYESIVSPLQNPKSFRDFYAFRKHVEAGRKNRGLDMIPEYDKIPVFYFSNHQSITGPGEVKVQKQHLNKLDFEFEIGIIISKQIRNIKAKDAYKYIAGLTILNDWSARAIQLQEMKLNLGPAKGKDFSTSIGPFLVPLDELKSRIVGPEFEMRYDLSMLGYLNDNLISTDNLKNISWSFADMIERASYGVDLYPGDLIGSGTCSTGCLLELNLSSSNETWLKPGDEIKLTVDCLGTLLNKVVL